MLLHEATLAHILDFALPLVEHHEALVSLFIKPVQAALKNTLVLQHTDHCPQFGITCTIAEIAFCCILQVVNQNINYFGPPTIHDGLP